MSECPAGGEHQWVRMDSGDLYATHVHYWWACDNCGDTMPDDPDDP